MLFNSISFLIFLPIALCGYYFSPKRYRYIWLLLCSYYFYMSWNIKYVFLLFFSTLIIYLFSWIAYIESNKGRKNAIGVITSLCILINVSILIIFKYNNFILNNIAILCTKLGMNLNLGRVDILLPVGLSFYIFQSLGYYIDVCRGSIEPEKNFLKYALFVSFFPQLVAGPIEKSTNLLPQIQQLEKIKLWNYSRIKHGFFTMLYGFFLKLVIADRISLVVNNVYNNYTNYGLIEIVTATILFAIQIYCDFNGYSCIAIGVSEIMGIRLIHNFKQPYLALNINDFWKRWHISLTTWLTDYLYIPLGGNRRGIIKKFRNIMIVFLVSGFWHGASWKYVFWGALHGVYLIAWNVKKIFIKENDISHTDKNSKTDEEKYTFSTMIRKCAITFALVDFAWIFFSANSFRDAIMMMKQCTKYWHLRGITNCGLDKTNWIILILAILILFIVDLLHEKNINILSLIEKQEFWFRWFFYILSLWIIILLGIYGSQYDTSQFIYFQF